VRDFAIHDIAIYPIKVRWEKSLADEDEDTELVVFPRGNGIPSTKVLTFYRKAPFDIEAVYADPSSLPGSVNPWVGRLTVKDVGPTPTGDYSTVRVKARLNLHGILSFEAVYTEEIEEKEEMQVDGESSEPPKKKKVVKKNPIAYVAGYGGLDSSVVDRYREKELTMYANDKLVQDTEVRCLHFTCL
jgi:heat shock protein 4